MGRVSHSTSRQRLQHTNFPNARGNAREPAGHKHLTVTQHDAEIRDDLKRQAVDVL